jgi:hypothetical protein
VFSTFEESWGILDLNKTTDIYATQLEPDEDADGMDDRWEKQFFAGSGMGPDEDFDHDGVSNADEFTANTDPTDPKSFTQLQAIRSASGAVELRWKGEPNRAYRIQSSDSLSSPTWQLHDFSSLGTGAPMQWSPPIDETTERYYRLMMVH